MSEMIPPAPDHPSARCPTCQREVNWPDDHHRPFCSVTCRLVDLGVWLDEGHRISEPEDASPDSRLGSE